MALKTTHDPDVIESRQGGGCLILFGLPFLLAGTAVLLIGVGAFPVKDRPPALFAVPFGAVFALVGLAIITGRSGVRLDGRARTANKWWLCLGLRGSKDVAVTPESRIRVKKEVRRGKNSSTTVYPVRLVGGEKDLDIETCMTPEDARATAEQICKHLKLDMEDLLTGPLILREHDKLDESLRERVQRTGESMEVGDPPEGTRIGLEQEGKDLVITLPPRGLRGGGVLRLLPIVIPFIFMAAFLSIGAGKGKMPPEIKVILFAVAGVVVGIPMVAVVLIAVAKAKQWVEIRVSKERLRVTTVGLFRRKIEEIPAEELEDLTPPADPRAELRERLEQQNAPEVVKRLAFFLGKGGSRPIQAVSDRRTIKFGKSLAPAEQEWLYAVVKRVLTA